MKAQFVLDASALLSMVLDEHGHERVHRILRYGRFAILPLLLVSAGQS